MTLQKVKDDYAKEIGYRSWDEMRSLKRYNIIEFHHDEVSVRYAKAKLDEAAERANVYPKQVGPFGIKWAVDKESITSIKLD